jgi:CheY-like chemotaxis protein
MGSKMEKPRALLVDDDEPDRHHTRDIFLREGFTVDEAVNGREALDRIRENSYDIIVLDILMPYVDGYEVMRHLKTQAPDVLNRTVIVSRLNLKDMQVFFPGCRLIQKPASREDLMRAAREYRTKQ